MDASGFASGWDASGSDTRAAYLSGADPTGIDCPGFDWPPGATDGAIQAAVGLAFADAATGRMTVVPGGVARVRLHGCLDRATRVLVERRMAAAGRARFDASLLDADGVVLAELIGLEAAIRDTAGPVATAAPAAIGTTDAVVAYGPYWRPDPGIGRAAVTGFAVLLPEGAELEIGAEQRPGNNNEVPLDGGAGRRFADNDRLPLGGADVLPPNCGGKPQIIRPAAGAAGAAGWRAGFAALAAAGTVPERIADLRSLLAPPSPVFDAEAAEAAVQTMVALVSGWLMALPGRPLRLIRAYRYDDQAVPAEACLEGLARALAFEAPGVSLSLLGLDAAAAGATVAILAAEFAQPDAGHTLVRRGTRMTRAWRQVAGAPPVGARHVGALQVGTGQAGAPQIAAPHVGAPHVGAPQAGRLKPGRLKPARLKPGGHKPGRCRSGRWCWSPARTASLARRPHCIWPKRARRASSWSRGGACRRPDRNWHAR